MSRRILDETTKSTFASDDYLYMDGETDGSSKITPNNLVSSTTAFRNLSNYVNQDLYNAIEQNTIDIEGIQTDITDLKADIGDLEELETTDKSSLVNAINEAASTGGGGLTEDVKQALLDCFDHVVWDDDDPTGQTYIDALEDALYPPASLVSINAVYSGGSVYTTASLDDLKADLVVTATYDDSTTTTVTSYTLSGTLEEGTNTITVAFGGMTTTFTVTAIVWTTSPVIVQYDKGYKSDLTLANVTGLCVTDTYWYELDMDALKATTFYDETNDYFDTQGVPVTIKKYFPNTAGISGSNNKTVYFDESDGIFTFNSVTYSASETNIVCGRQNSKWANLTNNKVGIAFTLATADVEDSYCYWTNVSAKVPMPVGVNVGDIIFAGANTPYYGMHNISEATV